MNILDISVEGLPDELSDGVIITIPSDQHGNPVYAIDPITREVTGELQKFRVRKK